jgi:hypothetical protein
MMSGGKLSSDARHFTSSFTAAVFSSSDPPAMRDFSYSRFGGLSLARRKNVHTLISTNVFKY